MLLGAGGYGPVKPNQYEKLWGVPLTMVHKKIQGLQKNPTTECRFWPETRTNNQDGTMVKMFSVIPSKVHNLLQKNQTYVWYQDDISLSEHSLVGTIQLGTTGRKKLKYPNMVDVKQWMEFVKQSMEE